MALLFCIWLVSKINKKLSTRFSDQPKQDTKVLKRKNSPEAVGRKSSRSSSLKSNHKISNYKQENIVTKYAYSTKKGIGPF